MAVDAHVHLWANENLPEGNRLVYARWAAFARLPYRDPYDILPRVGPIAWDPEGVDLMKYMDTMGIDRVVNMVVDWGLAWGMEPEWDVYQVNQHASSLMQKYPGRYFYCAGVDARRENAADVLEKAVKEWGAVGVKLLVANGFSPDDRICYPLYELARDLDFPVVIHTGEGDVASYPKEAHPFNMAAPARDFPTVKFVAAHTGGGLDGVWQECRQIGLLHNIYFDLSEWQFGVAPTARSPHREEELFRVLHSFRDWWGAHRIMWCTDYMKGHSLEIDRYWVELFKDLPARGKKYGYTFTQEEADLMFGGAADLLYGLEKKATVTA